MKPSQLARRRASHVIVFGEPKVGKSTLVTELLFHGFNLTWVSMDNGHEVVFKKFSIEQLDNQLNIIVIPDTKEFPVAGATCLKIISGRETRICDLHGQVECSSCKRLGEMATWSVVNTSTFGPKDILVFDHIQQVASSLMNRILINDKVGEEDKIEWKHYGIQGVLMDKFLTNIQQAHYNVVCITHVSETELEDGTKKLVPLVGTTNFSRNAGKYFDHMVYCEVQNSSHKFGSSSTYKTRVVTGSRTDVAIEQEKIPSLKKFFDGSLSAEKEVGMAGVSAAEKILTTADKLEKIVPEPKLEDSLEPVPPAEVTESPAHGESTSAAKLKYLQTLKRSR